jgi:hypothetical protein
MNGVTAFANGLHWILNYLIASAVLGIIGLTAMTFSVIFRYSKRQDIVKSFILAVIGTVLLIPAIIVGAIFSAAFVLNTITSYGIIEWRHLPFAILGIALPVLVIVYDIKVIVKYIKQKKNIPTEEQQNG